MNDPAIEIIGVTKRFLPAKGIAGMLGHSVLKEPVTAVDGVDLQVEKGELFGLLGPNGAGKTTLIKILCTLILPTSGTVRVNGYDVVRQEQLVRQSIGLVGSEERSFYWRLNGRQNLEFFATLYGLHGQKMHRRIQEVLELMGLERDADRMFQTYSTGMKQKMCIARGLLTDPAVLFLDEPTRSVDPMAAEGIRTFIKEMLVRKQGRTVVLTTHRLEEAAHVCDRIAIMSKGRIRACGTLSELRSILKSPCRYEIEVDHMPMKVYEALMQVEDVEEACLTEGDQPRVSFISTKGNGALSEVMRLMVESSVKVLHCNAEEVSLEEIFSELVRFESNVS